MISARRQVCDGQNDGGILSVRTSNAETASGGGTLTGAKSNGVDTGHVRVRSTDERNRRRNTTVDSGEDPERTEMNGNAEKSNVLTSDWNARPRTAESDPNNGFGTCCETGASGECWVDVQDPSAEEIGMENEISAEGNQALGIPKLAWSPTVE